MITRVAMSVTDLLTQLFIAATAAESDYIRNIFNVFLTFDCHSYLFLNCRLLTASYRKT